MVNHESSRDDGGPPGPRISIAVPAWNEEANLGPCLRTLLSTFEGQSIEVIVVDDGSKDGTLAAARRFEAEHPGRIRVLAHGVNQGLGAALKTAFHAARGRYVTICASDYLMTPEDWAPFAREIGRADVLVGCRERREGYNPLMRFNSWLYPYLVRILFGLRLRDVNWTCVYRRDLVDRVVITQRGIPMLVEILVKLRDLGASFLEVDCRMQPRTTGTASASRVKVMWRTLAGLLGFWRSYRAGPRPAPGPAEPPSTGARP